MEVIEETTYHRVKSVLQVTVPEIIVYTIMVIGFLGDQLTTRIAFNIPWIVESNYYVVRLMTRGLWLPLDVVLAILSVSAHLAMQRVFKMKSSWVTLSLPLAYGLVKFSAAVWNILLIFG